MGLSSRRLRGSTIAVSRMASMIQPIIEKVGLQLLLEPQASGVIFRAACNTVGVVFPAYQSFKAIEDKRDNASDEQWLTYWAIYGLFSLIEGSTEDILSKAPYYYHAKFALLLWLQLPHTQGAKWIYTQHLRPHFLKFSPKIDVCIDKVGSALTTMYALYKVPIDSLVAFTGYMVAQAVAFGKWFGSEDDTASSGKKDAPKGGVSSGKAAQFISR